jgi:hypothetical protein
MKKLFTICFLIAITFTVKAQTAEETLEWLNVNLDSHAYGSSNEVLNNRGRIQFSLENITVINIDDKNVYTVIKYSEIKDVQKVEGYSKIEVKGSSNNKAKLLFISWQIVNDVKRSKYIKALKHMAKLNGAKLIDENLFGN